MGIDHIHSYERPHGHGEALDDECPVLCVSCMTLAQSLASLAIRMLSELRERVGELREDFSKEIGNIKWR